MHKKRLSVSVLLLLAVEIINKVFPLYIIHYVQKKLGVESFGYAQFGISVIEMSIPFIVFGYSNYGSIELGRYKDQYEKSRRLISSIFMLKLIHACLVFIFLTGLFSAVPSYEPYRSLILILSFVLFFSSLDSLWVQVGVQKVAIFSFFNGAAKLISFLLIISTVSSPDDAVLYTVFTLMANALICVFTGIYSLRMFPLLMPKKKDLWTVFKASRVYAVIVVMMVFFERIDLIIVEKMFGIKGVGLYSGPLRLIHSANQLISAAALPFFSEVVAITDKDSLAKHTRYAVFVLMLVLAPSVAGIWFVDQHILELIFSSEYAQMNRVLSFLMAGMLCLAMILVFGHNILLIRNAQSKMIISLALGGATAIILAFQLGEQWQYEGIAASMFLGKLVTALMTAYFAKKYISYFPWADFFKTGLAGGIMATVLWLASPGDFLITLLIGALTYSLLILLIYFKEIGFLWQRFKNR